MVASNKCPCWLINAIWSRNDCRSIRFKSRLEPFLYIDGTLKKDGTSYNVLANSVHAMRLSPELAATRRGGLDGSHSPLDSFAYLEALRRDPPPTMSWGGGGHR